MQLKSTTNLMPERQDVPLDGAAGRAYFVEPGDTPVNLERGNVERVAHERVAYSPTECLHGGLGLLLDAGLIHREVFDLRDRGIDLWLRRLAGLESPDGVYLLVGDEGFAAVRSITGEVGGEFGEEEERRRDESSRSTAEGFWTVTHQQ
ncbi:ERCC4 domain-containing protein [Psidium guajava]|nr:ERCC4 domain-containing protein [Psidium guajava]